MSRNQYELNFILKLKERLIGGEVLDVKIGYSTMIIVANERNKYYYNMNFGNSEILIAGKSNWIKSDDIESKLSLGRLFKNKITSFDIDDDGKLSIEFDQNANKIITKSDMNYEAWEINGPDGFQVVCMPGGELAIWEERS